MRGARAAWLSVAVAPLVCGCGHHTSQLQGSLSEVLPLTYKNADLVFDDQSVSVRFLLPKGLAQNVVLAVGADTEELDRGTALTVDLTQASPSGGERGTVTRDVEGDPRHDFPSIARGELKFSQPIAKGKTLAGSFHVTFEDGAQFASGRTVFGDFEATVP